MKSRNKIAHTFHSPVHRTINPEDDSFVAYSFTVYSLCYYATNIPALPQHRYLYIRRLYPPPVEVRVCSVISMQEQFACHIRPVFTHVAQAATATAADDDDDEVEEETITTTPTTIIIL